MAKKPTNNVFLTRVRELLNTDINELQKIQDRSGELSKLKNTKNNALVKTPNLTPAEIKSAARKEKMQRIIEEANARNKQFEESEGGQATLLYQQAQEIVVNAIDNIYYNPFTGEKWNFGVYINEFNRVADDIFNKRKKDSRVVTGDEIRALILTPIIYDENRKIFNSIEGSKAAQRIFNWQDRSPLSDIIDFNNFIDGNMTQKDLEEYLRAFREFIADFGEFPYELLLTSYETDGYTPYIRFWYSEFQNETFDGFGEPDSKDKYKPEYIF